MNARTDPWLVPEIDSLREVQRCLDAAALRGFVRSAIEESAERVLRGRDSVATARELLHRYRDAGRINAADCDRILHVLEARVSENADTIPGITPGGAEPDDPFTHTTVLPPEAAVRAAAADDRLQVGSVLRDRFMLQERVANGGMGVVYKALDRRLAEVDGVEPWVAIKVIAPELAGNAGALRALQQEAAKGRCLTHPNIVRFIDFDREDDLYFIVMEWLEGRSLAAILDAAGPQPDVATAFEIVRQIGEALAYAHRCGVVHADIKPGNIMVLPSGSVKLFDFGVARVRQQQDRTKRDDTAALGAATPAYSSMQVLTGEEPVVTDDVFSLACLAYRLLAGHRVFGPRNAAEAAERGMEPQRPQGISDAQWKALRKALSHARVARFASANAFLDAFLAPPAAPAARSEPLVIPDEAVAERRFEVRRRRWPQVVLLLLLLTAALGVALLRPEWLTRAVSYAERALPATTPAAGPRNDRAREAPPQPRDNAPAESAKPPPPAAAATPSAAGGEEGAAGSGVMTTGDTAAAAPSLDESGESGESGDVPAASGDTAHAVHELPDPAGIADVEDSTALVLAAPGQDRPELSLTLHEGGDAIAVDIYRWFGLAERLTVRIDEVGFSGNRSPRDAGQYTLSGNGVFSFDRDQRHATLAIAMPADNDREPDQQVSLLLRDYYNPEAELGMLNVSLLDDDQRAFEATYAVNTIAFQTSQIAVPERNPAVQIDVLRLNPDRRTLTVSYTVSDVTATDGEDYFSPGRQSITFGPGQRMARLLIPLVQDSLPEADEAFYIELDVPAGGTDTFRRIAVIIRDDD